MKRREEIEDPIELFDSFEKEFPLLTNDITKTIGLSDHTMEVYYEDGSVGIYDQLLHSFRYIPRKARQQMTESRWRIELGHKIYRTMMERGMLMSELSDISGISYSSLSKYINGHKSPGSYTLKRIATSLGVEVGYLTDFEHYYD